MPGVLLRVVGLCSLLVVFNTRFAVGFRVSMIGGASVMRGTVIMGVSSITPCSASRSRARQSASTLCLPATGGGLRIFLTRRARSRSNQRPFGVSLACAVCSVSSWSMLENVGVASMKIIGNVVGTVRWSPRYGKRAFLARNNYRTCIDLLLGPGRMHPRLGKPMICACHHLHIR